jgi:TRAP-type C4-dicarboxylate transport system substrate-binding protein
MAAARDLNHETRKGGKIMFTKIAVLAAAAGAFVVTGSALAQTKTIKLLSSWDRTQYAALEGALVFQEQVKKDSDGKLVVEIKGPETVPPFQQIQPVTAGVFDMLFTHGVYHAGSKGIALLADAIEPNLDKRREPGGVFDYIDKYYQKHNKLKLIAISITGTHGYQLLLRDAPNAQFDFKGLKIRATQSYFGVIKMLGGTPVVLPPNDVYSALEKGVVDGAAFPAAGVFTTKWYEVAHYRLRPTFGTSNQPLLYNMDAWAKLSPDEQKTVLQAGRETEKIMINQGNVTLAKEEAELDKLGMKIAQFPADKAELIKKTFFSSVWELGEQCCADGAKELHQIAQKASLTY